MSIDELFDPLTTEEIQSAPKVEPEEELVPIVPVPDDTPEMDFRHPLLGKPTATWAYFTRNSQLVGYILRFEYEIGNGRREKEFLPVTWCEWGGDQSWRAKGFPIPRPLFQLPEILARPTAPILVCEGEKTALAAAKLFPDMVTTTVPFGTQSIKNADWSPVAGRRVIVAPDNDDIGEDFCELACEAAYNAKAAEVLVLRPEKIAAWVWKDGHKWRRHLIPPGWDLADALAEGWTSTSIAMKSEEADFYEPAPKPLVSAQFGRAAYRLTEAGVQRQVEIKEFGMVVGYYWKLTCGHLELVAETRDGDSASWGKLFKVKDPDGNVTEWHLANRLLGGDGKEYREQLLSRGLKFESKKPDRDYLQEYLSTVTSETRARLVDRVGWHGDVYVTNAGAIGQDPSQERIVFDGLAQSKVGQASGTLAEWQETVAKYAAGSSKLAFAICAAFAAPLILHTHSESGGFHFVGSSSVGKTTALVVAGSVWGGGGTGGYLRSWRTTDNGLESIAAAHCDSVLCLDEMGQAIGRVAGASAYMLANGVGKTRSDRSGKARPVAEWRTLILSTGEIGLADKVGEDSRGSPVAAGQEIRIIDLEADAGKGLGIFEDLHEFDSASDLARHLKSSAETHYGHAGRAFVAKLAESLPAAVAETTALIEDFNARYLPKGKIDGQVERVARKFGLVAAAGELAMRYGLLPWSTGDAMKSVALCFNSWLDARGTVGSLEEEQAVAKVRAYIERHGSSRFANANGSEEVKVVLDISIQNRVGFVREGDDGREYCFFLETWKDDVCRGLDHKSVARALLARGFLAVGKDNRLNKVVRLRNDSTRMFVVKETILLEPVEKSEVKSSLEGYLPRSEESRAMVKRLRNLRSEL